VILAAVAVVAAFFASVHAPGAWAHDKWAAFKHPGGGGSSTHLTSLGSNRYDFWRVALDETRAHPLRGLGGRGFYNAYLQLRRSDETPLRAHSLYLDTLSELGIPGLLLLLAGLGAPLVLLTRRLRSAASIGAFGAFVYFLTHAAVDWIWTVPTVGVFAFLLAGIGTADEGEFPLGRRTSYAAATAGVLLACFAFAPPWLAYKYVVAAYKAGDPGSDLSTARTLDPLSLEPDWAQWRLAATPAAKVTALRRVLGEEPSSVAALFQLGLAYRQAGQNTAAHDALERAHALDPRDATITGALSGTGP
jgi:hypothetical protein